MKILTRFKNALISKKFHKKLEMARKNAEKLNHHHGCSCTNCILNAMRIGSYQRKIKELDPCKRV